MDKFSYLNTLGLNQINDLYEQYKSNPLSVDISWQKFFEGFEFALTNYNTSFDALTAKEFKVINLINAYRERGHLFTKTNPVRTRRKYSPTLDIDNFGLQESDLKDSFEAAKEVGLPKSTLNNIIEHLQATYCRSIGVEYMYIRSPETVAWLKDKMETSKNEYPFSVQEKNSIYHLLLKAVSFETFIHKKFPGQKSFSLEGGESLIPALETVVNIGYKSGITDFVIGMAHRGRLSVLANILKKPYADIFSEFAGKEYSDSSLLGDVKYHLGYTRKTVFDNNNTLRISLCPNPSHLEAVGGVAEGLSRATIDIDYKGDNSKVLPILIHGDASIAAQGVVYEVLQMSGLKGYTTGGTLHFIINNQIGFTTNYLDARTSTYCTDVAKTIQSPIFHVNGDDVEAVVYTTILAMEYRQRFKKDVFIDLLCYRKYGHNESDEPRFTQPLLYKIIEKHPNPALIYYNKLISENIIDKEKADRIENKIFKALEDNFNAAKEIEKGYISNFLADRWKNYSNLQFEEENPITGIDKQSLYKLTEILTKIPDNVKLYHKSVKLQELRREMVTNTNTINWGMTELLAYASLLEDGYSVRLSGQDTERGTFSHRHAVFTIEDSEDKYIPLQNVSNNENAFYIYNSLLSEYGVLGFEYGYAMAAPKTLTIWEAQFGDFSNVAQVIFDQFISTAEEKWKLLNGLVLYLPHGYEGQGSEHSSARMERILILCEGGNIQAANLTTPANLFHILRRQMLRKSRKPLIIFTPKSLLRHPLCFSTIEELCEGSFQNVIYEKTAKPENIKRIVLCTGKIYYELEAYRLKKENNYTLIVRIEELYPFPAEAIKKVFNTYNSIDEILWVQEEPENMGAWPFVLKNMPGKSIRLVSRPASASPATGANKFHIMQQERIISKAFNDCNCENACAECGILCVSKLMKTYYK